MQIQIHIDRVLIFRASYYYDRLTIAASSVERKDEPYIEYVYNVLALRFYFKLNKNETNRFYLLYKSQFNILNT